MNSPKTLLNRIGDTLLNDKKISNLARDYTLRHKTPNITLVLIGKEADIAKIDQTRIAEIVSESWSCQSIADVFRLGLNHYANLFVLLGDDPSCAFGDFDILLNQRTSKSIETLKCEITDCSSDKWFKKIKDKADFLSQRIVTNLCLEEINHEEQTFPANNSISSEKVISDPESKSLNKLRKEILSKLSDQPELFLREEIKRIRKFD